MMDNRKIRFLLGSGAFFTALTLIFPTIGFFEWITMVPMIIGCFLLCKEETTGLWKAYRYGFFTVFCFYLVVYHWFSNLYPLDFVGIGNSGSVAVIAAAWVGLSILQAIPGGLIFLLLRLMEKSGVFRKAVLLRPVAFSALWVIFEWSSSLSWVGVPWGRLVLGQAEYLSVLQISSVFGSYAVSFLLLFVNGMIAHAILNRSKRGEALCMASLIFFANILFGVVWMKKPTENSPIKVAVIQGNINSHDKWGSSSYLNTRQTHADLTRAAANEGAEIVVWAETALPYSLNANGNLASYCSDLARECNVTLIVGAFYEDDENQYNSLYLIYPNGEFSEVHYDKRHLVPFGEYVPMRNLVMALIPPLAEVSALSGDLTPGDSSNLFSTKWGNIGSLICFDSIYEHLTLDSVRDGANLMVISTNDSWFYNSAAVYMHCAQAQIRAIESGRYILRSANTGISAIIDPNGRCIEQIPALEKGYAVAEVSCITQKTPYTVYGNLFVYFCIAFSLLLLLYPNLLSYKKAKMR